MTVDNSHPELFPEEAGADLGALPPFEMLFDAPTLSVGQLESMIEVAVDPATPEPDVDLIPEYSSPDFAEDPSRGDADPWDNDTDYLPADPADPVDPADPAGDLELDLTAEDAFPDEDPLAGL